MVAAIGKRQNSRWAKAHPTTTITKNLSLTLDLRFGLASNLSLNLKLGCYSFVRNQVTRLLKSFHWSSHKK